MNVINDFVTIPIRKEWFDMILLGIKKEEYREIKPYWVSRLIGNKHDYKEHHIPCYRGIYLMPFGKTKIRFINGYSSRSRQFIIEWKSIEVKCPKIEWCPKDTDYSKFVFCLNLGIILSTKNI